MRLCISQCQRTAPRTAEDLPLVDPKMLAQLFDISHEVPRGVLFKRRVRRAFTRATLIQQDNAVAVRIVKLAILWNQPAAGPAVQKHDRLAFWIPALLVVDVVQIRDLQVSRIERFNRSVKISYFSHLHPLSCSKCERLSSRNREHVNVRPAG